MSDGRIDCGCICALLLLRAALLSVAAITFHAGLYSTTRILPMRLCSGSGGLHSVRLTAAGTAASRCC